MGFVSDDLLKRLAEASREELDRQDYGVVKVDSQGKVLIYNHYEARLAGLAPSAAEGRNFFTEIAPCTNNRLFMGKFKQGVEKGELNEQFNYTFTYKMKPTNVAIHLLHDKKTQTNWIFVKAKAA